MRSAFLLAALAAAPLPAQSAEAVYYNGRLWTGDATQPAATALVVAHGRLRFVGSDSGARALVGPTTRLVDLEGRRVVPGFIDSHWHLSTASRVDLTDAGTPDSIVARLQRWAATRPAGAWIVGRGWTPSDFPLNGVHKRYLDRAFPAQPVLITDRDGHQALANSAAMRTAGVTAQTVDPVQGVIERDVSGVPTGLLKEAAAGLVSRLIPPPTRDDVAMRIDQESIRAVSFGITMVQEASRRAPRGDVFDLLTAASRADTLRIRWRVSLPFDPDVTSADLAAYLAVSASHPGPWLRFGIAKGMLDGTVDALTAAMLEPYTGTVDRGLPFWSAATLNAGVARYDSAGLQIELHAIGDQAVRMALDAYASAQRTNGSTGRRHRIEHVEVPSLHDLPRFRQLGVIASTQAIFATPDATALTNYAPLLGPERASLANNFRQFDDAGAVQAFGSDYPVFPMDVLLGIYTAVTRLTPQGTPHGGWYPAGRISVEAALRHFTQDAAYAAFMEQETGTLRAGLLADFVVLSRDILTVPSRELLMTRVERTIVGGREAYVAPTDR